MPRPLLTLLCAALLAPTTALAQGPLCDLPEARCPVVSPVGGSGAASVARRGERVVQITVAADNAWFLWVDGRPLIGANASSWRHSDTFTLRLPAGEHALAVYMEDWGGYAYFAATVRVDGRLVSKTGDGSWRTDGVRWTDARGRDTYRRGYTWPKPPADARTGLEVRPPEGWTRADFDDRGWHAPPRCTPDRLARYAAEPAREWDDFDPLHADGARFVFTRSACTTPHRTAPGAKRRWGVGLFRTTLTL